MFETDATGYLITILFMACGVWIARYMERRQKEISKEFDRKYGGKKK